MFYAFDAVYCLICIVVGPEVTALYSLAHCVAPIIYISVAWIL